MNTARPGYAPPSAPPGRAALEAEWPEVFSDSQRIGRLRMCCYQVTGALVIMLLAALLVLLAPLSPVLSANDLLLSWGALVAAGVLMTVWMLVLTRRRLHDVDRTGWWALLVLVPVLNLLLFVYLLLVPGSDGTNRYGAPSGPNGVLVTLFGGLIWVISLVSLLANVLALGVLLWVPSYQAQWLP